MGACPLTELAAEQNGSGNADSVPKCREKEGSCVRISQYAFINMFRETHMYMVVVLAVCNYIILTR